MKRLVLISLAILFFTLACGPKGEQDLKANRKSFNTIQDDGYSFLATKKYEEALKKFKEMKEFAPLSPWSIYDQACVYSRWGKTKEALDYLDKAVDKGFTDSHHIETDPDLENIREVEGFSAIVDKAREKEEAFDKEWKGVFKEGVYHGRGFDSLKALQAYYKEASNDLYEKSFQYPSQKVRGLRYRIYNEELDSLKQMKWEEDPAVFVEIIRLYHRVGREGDAEEEARLCKAFIEKFPKNDLAGEVAYRHVEFLEQQAESSGIPRDPESEAVQEILKDYRSVVDAYPGTKWAALGLVKLAVAAKDRGDEKATLQYLDELDKEPKEVQSDSDVAFEKMMHLRTFIYNRKGIPPLDVKDWNGTMQHLADYRGKVLLLDFWATWCGPCVREIPNVVKAYKAYHEKGFEVLGISLDNKMKTAELKKWCAEKGMAWPQIYDEKAGWKAPVARRFEVSAIPTMVIIDRKGKVHDEVRGEELIKLIGELVQE